MKPEFIAWDREEKRFIESSTKIRISLTGKVFVDGIGEVDCFDIYPYIHRKDKDGNKVYEGSRVESEFGGLHTIIYDSKNCRYGSVDYDRFYPIDFIVCGGKVIGHIAEED